MPESQPYTLFDGTVIFQQAARTRTVFEIANSERGAFAILICDPDDALVGLLKGLAEQGAPVQVLVQALPDTEAP